MRQRLSISVVCLALIAAVTVGGCGDNKSSKDAADPNAKAVIIEPTSPVAREARVTFNSCVDAAIRLSGSKSQTKAKRNCLKAYNKVDDGSKTLSGRKLQAQQKCREAASTIPNTQGRNRLLTVCDRIGKVADEGAGPTSK